MKRTNYNEWFSYSPISVKKVRLNFNHPVLEFDPNFKLEIMKINPKITLEVLSRTTFNQQVGFSGLIETVLSSEELQSLESKLGLITDNSKANAEANAEANELEDYEIISATQETKNI